MNPLLSICIPTYNRSKYLQQTIESIVRQDEFVNSSKVEIVISDNCSTDNTRKIVDQFISTYGSKIKYFKTERNIGFDNFEQVLYKGTGQYLKLNNDTLLHKPHSLAAMLAVINDNMKEKNILFFMNREQPEEITLCHSLDEFIEQVYFFNTWIAAFGIWKEDLKPEANLFRYNASSIPQTDILCRSLASGKKAVVVYKELFISFVPSKKGGYNIAEVFGYNYLNILKEFVRSGHLSQKIYDKEKKKLLLTHINPFYFDIHKQFAFDKNGYFKWLWNDYKHCPYFYFGYIKMYLKFLLNFIFSIHKTVDRKYKYKTIILFGIKIKIKKKIK